GRALWGDPSEPGFLAYPRAFMVQSGTDAVLSCQITGDPRPSILWEKDKIPIEPSGRFHVEAKGDLYSLLVSRATPQDSGVYVCKAKNKVGETYAAATLKVEVGEPREEEGCLDSEAPAFLVAPSSIRVCRGEDVMFTCRVSGQPCPVVQWEKDGHKLSDLFESSHFAVGQEPEDWHFLKLFGVRPPDGGVYVCRARSGFREALAAAVLLVEAQALPDSLPNGSPDDGPEMVPGAKAFTVSAGKHAKFRCYVTGKPKPEIIWQKDGEPLTPGRRHLIYEDREGYFILKVLYCKPQDQGLYVCTASNTAGQTLSAVQLQVKEHRLQFQVQLADVEVAEREDAVLECQVPLETIPTAWYLEDRELQPSHKYVMEEQGVVRRLTIRDARTDDDGIYLCQMKDKGRSIAEVSVRGVIVKRLPRKLDVMEGENAVFCVETQEAVEGTCWSRDGLQLQESPRTVLKSFGRTHLLVLVHVTRQDAGIISFSVRESQTSSQLRVKCVKRDPPSAPVAAEMSVVESNAALLTWCPAPDAHLRAPSHYLLERREASGGEWVQCLATDLPSHVRVLGDSVPREADYCFRICAANEHGRSSPVEFPGSVHLGEMPTARLERGLQDARVKDGEDAWFSLELSAAVHGTWFLNGVRLDEEKEEAGGRCSVRCHGMEHSLLIRGVQQADSGAQVTFVSGSVRDSATLHVQEAPVRIVSSNEEAPHAYVAGQRVELWCQLSRPAATVHWYKDGEEVEAGENLVLEQEGPLCRLVLPSARTQDTGEFVCDAGGDSVFYTITVAEAPVKIVNSNEEAPHAYVAGQRVELWCQLSRPAAPVHWYKDGEEVEAGENLVLEQEGPLCRLVLPSAQPQDTGEFVCDAGGDSVFYTITVTSGILHPLQRSLELLVQPLERVELRCELSVPDAPVRWFKDGLEVDETDNLLLVVEGAWRCLFIPRSSVEDTGEYICESKDEAVSFDVKVSEPPVRILQPCRPIPVVTVSQGETVTLGCELSRADAHVHWAKEGVRLEAGGSLVLEEEGAHRRLLIPMAQPEHSGKYICDATDDTVIFTVQVLDTLVRILERGALPTQRHCRGERAVLWCELCKARGDVVWKKDGRVLAPSPRWQVMAEGRERSLVLSHVEPEDAGEYCCESKDDQTLATLMVQGELTVMARRVWGCSAVLQNEGSPLLCPNVLAVVPRVVEIITELQNLTVLEGEDATFKCLVSPEDVAVAWQMNGQPVVPGERLLVTRHGLCHSLHLRQCQLGDAGTVTANAEGLVSTARLSVQEAQVLFVRKLQNVVAEEQGDVCLEVEVSHEAAEVQWLKHGVLLQPGSKYQLQEVGCQRTLTIRCLGLADRGTYRCETLHDRTARLLVRGMAPQQASLGCVAPTLPVLQPFCPGRDAREELATSGTCWQVSPLSPFSYAGMPQPPVTMVRVPRDLGVPETGVANFECELSRPSAEVKWFKDGQELRPGPNCRIYSAGRRRILQLSHCELADAGTYTCDAGDCCASATLHVQERQVRILQDLQDTQVQEGDNAVFNCEASHGDVKGEWFRDGEKIKVSSTVKIRQEGTRHFLLFCSVRPEDKGLIRFVAGTAVSEANLWVEALPIRIVKPLRDKTVLARHKATLECTVSHARGRVRWLRGDTEIFAGDKYEICNLDCYRTLIIHHVGPEDEDSYTCDAFDDRSTARLLVEGEGAPGAMSPQPTACKGLSTGVGGAS
uniref:Obscurin-like protein 1 n=1 Tax=Melopsittacus undulatus TaxID=13146 RepID=A0A8C6JRK1_MELUD